MLLACPAIVTVNGYPAPVPAGTVHVIVFVFSVGEPQLNAIVLPSVLTPTLTAICAVVAGAKFVPCIVTCPPAVGSLDTELMLGELYLNIFSVSLCPLTVTTTASALPTPAGTLHVRDAELLAGATLLHVCPLIVTVVLPVTLPMFDPCIVTCPPLVSTEEAEEREGAGTVKLLV